MRDCRQVVKIKPLPDHPSSTWSTGSTYQDME